MCKVLGTPDIDTDATTDITSLSGIYFDATTVDNEDRLYTDSDITTEFLTDPDGDGIQHYITLYRHHYYNDINNLQFYLYYSY